MGQVVLLIPHRLPAWDDYGSGGFFLRSLFQKLFQDIAYEYL